MAVLQFDPPVAGNSALKTTRSRRTVEAGFAGLLALAILLTFWSQQRYPALLKKLHAGSGVQVKGAISFDALLKVNPQMPLPERVARTSVNWLWTNRFGMYFALPFGAAMMTLMAQSKRPKRFGSAAGNVLCGAVAGAPMGVCTNCATPIGQSLLAGGASARMTVAAMISSPSFNPVVVAMAFVLFPLPLAMLRVAAPLVLLSLVPVLVPETVAKPLGFRMPEVVEPVGRRLVRVAGVFLKNLLRLTLMTLPWMLLAAVIGALAAELIPAYGTHIAVSLIGVVAVAVLGTLLPVPMAFDVALAFVLYHAGVPVPYVAAFLCTLGPVSVYSLSALGQQLGRKSALRLAGATAAIGIVAGVVAMWGRIG
jgi:uncharacterized membrane protein YraQ (UPF0718 family)